MVVSTTKQVQPAPAPWTLKGTIYLFMIYISGKHAAILSSGKNFLYSPLEANSSFLDSKPVGGLGMVQVIRYSESPVGPYDELIIVPGNFEHPFAHEAASEKAKNLRVTRIYVSQEKTCWNGRMSEALESYHVFKVTDMDARLEYPKAYCSVSVRRAF
jgi:hypothetical protein